METLQNPPAIPVALLQALLGQLNVAVDRKNLADSCLRANQTLQDLRPAEWLGRVLIQAQIKGVAPIQLGWRRFDARRLPALVWHQAQWAIARRKSSETIALSDASGKINETLESELQDALVVWLRVAGARQEMSNNVTLAASPAARLVWSALFREPGWISKVLIATLIVNVLAIATSIFAMQVYDRVVPTLAYATLTTLVVGMLIIIGIDWGLKTLRARILDSVSCEVDKRVSQQVFDHLLHLQIDQMPKSLGTLAAQVGGLDAVRQFFSSSIIFALVDLPFALLFLSVIAIIGGAVAWVYLLLLPIALLLGYVTQYRLKVLLKHQMMRSNERQGLLVDSIRGAETIRAANATWRFSAEWQAITATIDGYNVQQKAIANFSAVTAGSLSSLAYVGAVVVGVWQIEAGVLTQGGLIACSILGGRIIGPISQSVQYLTQWQGVAQSLEMVNRVLNLPQERRPEQSLLLPDTPPKSIDLERVRFAYPESPIQQVDIVQFTVSSGERVLLLGPVGCGKSTLLKVLAGLYRPSEGRIRLGDADLWEIDPLAVASHVGYLPQVVQLFKGTLRSNLALSGTTGDSRLLQVARELGVDSIAATNPLGMDLPISEGGEGLSGGQRQLVALARLAITQPRIWLLDEPTASLDSESEAKVWKVLAEQVRPEDILIVATHRPLQALKLATRVVVMQQGNIVRDGKPEAVLPQMSGKSLIARTASAPVQRLAKGGMLDVV
jgi:ATP-binding cassette subfamily C protein LapB